MSTAYIIHCDKDLEFVRDKLVRPLPCNGFDRWVSSTMLMSAALTVTEAMNACHVIIGLISRAAADSQNMLREIEIGRASSTPMLVVQAEELTEAECSRFPPELWLLPRLDLHLPGPDKFQEFAALLPLASTEPSTLSDIAQPIEWDEKIFSGALSNVVKLHDYKRAETLIKTFKNHLKERSDPYPAEDAIKDLTVLRRKRLFKLMRTYGKAVITSGTDDEEVRRQFAQSLIEQREFDYALQVLNSIVADPHSREKEVAEAYGLIGRAYKQQYVDDPQAPGSHELLREAIKAYGTVYKKDHSKVWHGVNTASCIVRARRDGVEVAPFKEPREIATALLEEIERLEKTKKIGVWDYATRVEALIILKQYDEAMTAVAKYISHPDMDAFEVSSTYRQFDQVWELSKDRQGKRILDQLWKAVQRQRGVDFSWQPATKERGESVETKEGRRPLLIQVADPQWQPKNVSDLTMEARVGTIISAYGSEASVKELLSDPDVISIDDSRPGGAHDCKVSIPYIGVGVKNIYSGAGGTYTEKGANALIAFIDNGIDILHQAFLDGQGQSRIMGIWDQTDPTGPAPAGFTDGTYHTAAQIADYVKDHKTPAGLKRNVPLGHGTHVASIAAGQAVGDFFGGVAPEAKILVIISDIHGLLGYSTSHTNALAFIDNIATQMNLPVVVNVSQGMNAGAHDGKSKLEIAFNGFTEGGRKAGRVVVKSAGNERGTRGHAFLRVSPLTIERLPWRRDPKAFLGERLELWWLPTDEFEFRLGAPVAPPPAPKSPREFTPRIDSANPKRIGTFKNGTPYKLVYTWNHIDNGHNLLEIELGDKDSKVAPGIWELEIECKQVHRGGGIHAWIEHGGGMPSEFEDHDSPNMTLSIPGTADNVITVGAIEALRPIEVARFSSYGPTRDDREKPDIAAPGVGIWAAAAGTDNEITRRNGTSQAAPHVAGAIALLLSRRVALGLPWLAASQITAALRQKTVNYTGQWNPSQGYGVLDVAALLAAFEAGG